MLEDDLPPRFAGRLLPVDLAVARSAARLHDPDPRPERDALLAATALAHGLTMATRNVRDFAHTGVPVVNPWSPGLAHAIGAVHASVTGPRRPARLALLWWMTDRVDPHRPLPAPGAPADGPNCTAPTPRPHRGHP